MTEIASLEVLIGADTRGLDRGLRTADRSLSSFGRSMQSAGREITGVGTALGTLAAPATLALGLAAREAINFESAFAGVRKTVDASEAEFAALEHAILQMATSPDELTSSLEDADVQLARIMELAGQLGVSGVDNLTEFTETVALLGMTTNLSVEEAATELARFANIVGMPIEDVERLGSTIVALGNNMATTEAEIVAMGQRLAGAGAVVGLSESQIMALAAALSSVGIEAEAGGSAFSRVMLDINSAVDGGGDKLNRLAEIAGMTADEFVAAWETNPANALVAFIDGLRDANTEGANMSAILDELGMDELRTRDALLRLATGTDVLSEALGVANLAWDENTALTEEAERRAETTESAINRLNNNLGETARQLGEQLTPAINDLSEDLIPILQQVGTWIEQNPELASTIAGVTLVVGGLALGLTALGTVIGSVGTIIAALASPIGLIVIAVGALALAFATNFLGIRTTVENVVNFVSGLLAGIESFIQGVIGGLQRLLTELGLIRAEASAAQQAVASIGAATGGHAPGAVVIPGGAVTNPATGGGGGGQAGWARGAGRAFGGDVSAGLRYTVGERGPETFVAPRDGMIVPAGGGEGIRIDQLVINLLNGGEEEGRAAGRGFMAELRALG